MVEKTRENLFDGSSRCRNATLVKAHVACPIARRCGLSCRGQRIGHPDDGRCCWDSSCHRSRSVFPQTIIILVPFLQSIPNELEEACLLDGCSRLGFFWRMVIPLSMPGVATTGILTFVGSWNAYMLPLFVLSDDSKYTLPLGVQMFSSEHSVDTAQVLAFTSLAMIPALICFTIFQKKIVGGLTGAVKG